MSTTKRDIYYRKLEVSLSGKSGNTVVIDREKYGLISASLQRLQGGGKPRSPQDYAWMRKYHLVDCNGESKIAKRGLTTLLVAKEDLFDVISEAHIRTGHAGRNILIKELQQSYFNVTQENIMLFLELCENCQLKHKKKMSSSGDSCGNSRAAAAFEELWRRLGESHHNTVTELEAKVSKLKKDRCLDAQRLEVFYNRNQQLKEENKTLQDTISHLEERLRAGECQRCAVLEETLKSSQGQNQQQISNLSEFYPTERADHLPKNTVCSSTDVICEIFKSRKEDELTAALQTFVSAVVLLFKHLLRLSVLSVNCAESERNDLEDDKTQLQAELQKLEASLLELKEDSSPEQEDGVIPDSPILSSSLPATNRLKKLKHVDKVKHVRYAERPLSVSDKSIFFEPNGATKSGRAEVLVPNTCELDVSHIPEDGNSMEEEIAETCRFELVDKHQKKMELDRNRQTRSKSLWKHDVRLKPYSPSASPTPGPDSPSERSPSLLASAKRFSQEGSVPRMKRKKGEIDEEVQEGGDERKKGKRAQLEGSRQIISREELNGKAGNVKENDQTETSNQEPNGPCSSPAFKKPHSKTKGDADGKKKAPVHPHGDGELSAASIVSQKHLFTCLMLIAECCFPVGGTDTVENMWSIDPALTLSVYEQGGDEEKEEAQHLGDLADTDCTWISHSMLQGRREGTQDRGNAKSRLGEKANDSLDMMFDTTAYGEYKSFNTSHCSQNQPGDEDDDEEEEEEQEFEQDSPEDRPRRGKTGQPTFAHMAVIRKKDERRKLKGTTCKECEVYYAHLPEDEKHKKLTECSRHRFLYIPPSTPENFWEVGFPSTQTCIDRGYIKEEKNPQLRSRRRQPLNALFTPKKQEQEQT
ncbi:DNA endonuclease RBBP8 [Cololabis saira]|uniref:DNA endonuclease RBBP8 n=1 Tax=Cololabis saira TaxID=129043 RepID=UPI002AD1F6CC|nr:DNA endonuclease RBBP8 [Cololabis saira]